MSMRAGVLLPEFDAWVLPILAALRERDREMLESGWSAEDSAAGRRFDAIGLLYRAASAHLGGDGDRAESLFVQAINATEACDGPEPAMILRAIYAELAPERQAARGGALRAYEWFTDVGANGYLRLFHDVWPLALDRAEAG